MEVRKVFGLKGQYTVDFLKNEEVVYSKILII